jgi:hypothetical protein
MYETVFVAAEISDYEALTCINTLASSLDT